MRKALQVISYLALVSVVAAPVLYYTGVLTLQANKSLMLASTVVWFVVTPFWMERKKNV